MGFFSRLKESLTKTRKNFVEKIETLVTRRRAIDEGFYEELEEILIGADIGINTAVEIVENLRAEVKKRKIDDVETLKEVLKELICNILGEGGASTALNINEDGLTVILVVGVNGVGKTTTIGKLAYYFKEELGKKVLLAAGDTFRAAAIDQLEIWSNRVGVEMIKHKEGADPAAVAYDAIQAARARRSDVLIVDTAGRLHTKSNLMDELKKIKRVINKDMPEAPQEILLVLDATTGQNAVSQAKLFGEAADVTGIALTKLDGTAKGGVVISIKNALKIPVKLIGIGEGIEDLRPFEPEVFAEALFPVNKESA
ncbi:signal recognition particle-docking protein FtsY [Desulfofarcimen acetoxidans DSM 771]|jgi:fused signal recognition particle receptor|uniref:Signal recognition particle receptor FtsY n=1 Tax=Desulfofarcimen acetoxidans (strain ATCC 49208 / DSM 771 / KCTC 5769 / VKM B-1644 / 5575) TaxID=485916 RepID=C8W587_DESAS|nr:signal recognition particle-docking protein FtsY [Desulfofarcimen acetoxidans]ACV62069.1 signal recognition particle-docking protein FtsY [Desulfofarcimen acetoxidans DSM 771]